MIIHFIGIGGIGVSALAQYYLARGHRVSGSDLISSEITDALRKKGAKLLLGVNKKENLPEDADLVIHSPAVLPSNPEIKKAKKLGIKIQSYPEALGELTKKYFTIAVSGAHGKSTTTAMIALILIKAGLDPTVIIGTKLKEFGNTNFRKGDSKYLVIEADEWNASFLRYFPKIIVLTNIEREHLDYYKNLKNIIKTFREYILHLPKDGWLVVNRDDKNISNLLGVKRTPRRVASKTSNLRVRNYSLKEKEAKIIKKVLKIPGEHNIYNALAALKVARILKIPDKISFQALSEYKGSWRRFEEKKLEIGNLKFEIIDDYAHHPTEIKATLKAAREKFPDREIWCVFQPHQYQRTFYLFNDFVKVFARAFKTSLVNKLIITDIYSVAGRETKKIKAKVNSEKLVKRIMSYELRIKNNIIYIPTVKGAVNYLKKNLKCGEVVIIMGAGDIYKIGYKFST